MAKGGVRPGAGKPKGYKARHTIDATIAKQEVIQRILERINPILDALFAKAEAGDIAAIKEVFDRGFGKAIQGVELSGSVVLDIDA